MCYASHLLKAQLFIFKQVKLVKFNFNFLISYTCMEAALRMILVKLDLHY